MNINNSVVLVTGANRGIGAHFVTALLNAGAAKVYAASRSGHITGDHDDRVVPLTLDITDPASVQRAAETATDVTLLINNAGIANRANLVSGDLDELHAEMDTNFWGTLSMVRAFAPTLIAAKESSIVNILSLLALFGFPEAGGYAASKAAGWSLSDNVRIELAPHGVSVLAAFLAYTDMMAGWDVPKNDPADVVSAILAGLERGDDEVFADEPTQAVKRGMASSVRDRYPDLGQG